MLQRMKNMLKKEKGFTLVELLAVIAILGIILAIAVPAVGGVIGNAEEDAHNANVDLVENAARLAYIGELETAIDGVITISELVSNGYLEGVPEAVGDYTYTGDDTVSITEDSSNGNLTVEYKFTESDT